MKMAPCEDSAAPFLLLDDQLVVSISASLASGCTVVGELVGTVIRTLPDTVLPAIMDSVPFVGQAMSGTDDNTARQEANEDHRLVKILKNTRCTRVRRLLVLSIVLIALMGVALWRATTPPPPQLNRPLLWRIRQLFPWFRRSQASRVVCGTNLAGLSGALRVYANDSEGNYPPPNKWCDLLVDLDFTTPKQFLCIDALIAGDRGPCHYAINPTATPNSPPNMVLLFETKAGWNQFGGPEILTIRAHDGMGKGSYVVFTDGKVRFIKAKDLDNLKWK